MNPLLDISPRVATLLGPEGLAQLNDVDVSGRLWCSVCQTYKPQGEAAPMAVVAAEDGDGVVVIGFAHRGCRDRHGDDCPSLLDAVSSPDGMDATAFFGVRATRAGRAVMAFEPAAGAIVPTGTGDTVDPYVAWHLAEGFTLARAGVEHIAPPVAPAWKLTARGGVLRLEHDTAGIGYAQDITEDLRTWLRVVKREGRALVLTGSDLGLVGDERGLPDLARAQERGSLVAATVLFRP